MEPAKRVRFPIAGVEYHSAAESQLHLESGAWLRTTLGEELRDAAHQAPEVPYIVAEDGAYSFRALDAMTESVAACLLDIGLRPGDRAIFQVGNVKEIVAALFGCFKAGVIPVCTLVQHREIEIGQLARMSNARAYFVQADFSNSFDQVGFARRMIASGTTLEHLIVLRGEPGSGEHSLAKMMACFEPAGARPRTRDADPLSGDVAMLQLSGGSTGTPKIIPRMHGEYLGASAAWNARQQLAGDDISLWPLPLIHNAGMIMMLVPSLLARRSLVIRARFEIDDFLRTIESHKVTYTGSIGPIAPQMIDFRGLDHYRLSSLRSIFTLSRAAALQQRTGVAAHLTYGITEGMLLASTPDSPPQVRFETMGWPVGISDEIRLLEPGSENAVPPGEIGEFCFRSPHSLRGYYAAPQLNAESFASGGFFRSGDLMRSVRVGDRVFYAFQGRLRDNINRGGEKFGAEELESLISEHPAIRDARVVAMPDSLLGEKACAFVILRPGMPAPAVPELGAFLLGRGLAKFKLPERIETVAEFPITKVGKVDKAALRAAAATLNLRRKE